MSAPHTAIVLPGESRYRNDAWEIDVVWGKLNPPYTRKSKSTDRHRRNPLYVVRFHEKSLPENQKMRTHLTTHATGPVTVASQQGLWLRGVRQPWSGVSGAAAAQQ